MHERKFGELLTERRRRLGISIDQAVHATKLRPQVIQAFERSDFSAMPPKGYAQGMLTSYARFLRLDPREILSIYFDQLYEYERERELSARSNKSVRYESPEEIARRRTGGSRRGAESSVASGADKLRGQGAGAARMGRPGVNRMSDRELDQLSEFDGVQQTRIRRGGAAGAPGATGATGSFSSPAGGSAGSRGVDRSYGRVYARSQGAGSAAAGAGSASNGSQRSQRGQLEPAYDNYEKYDHPGRGSRPSRTSRSQRGGGKQRAQGSASSAGSGLQNILSNLPISPKILLGIVAVIILAIILLTLKTCSKKTEDTQSNSRAVTEVSQQKDAGQSANSAAGSTAGQGDQNQAGQANQATGEQAAGSHGSTTDQAATKANADKDVVKLSIPQGVNCYIEVKVDGSMVANQSFAGPYTESYTVGKSIEITTTSPNNTKIELNGKAMRLNTSAGIGHYQYIVPGTEQSSAETQESAQKDSKEGNNKDAKESGSKKQQGGNR